MSKRMPSRPRSHVLETESRHAFRALIPGDWTFSSIEEDYGADGRVEIFVGGSATGLGFLVQLKGTDEKLPGALKTPFSTSALNYLAAQAEPTLLVRYHGPTGQVFAHWLHARDRNLKSEHQATVTVKWRTDDLIGRDIAAKVSGRLYEDVIRFRRFSAPLTASTPASVVTSGLSDGEARRIRLNLSARLKSSGNRLRLGPDTDGMRIYVSDSKISVDCAVTSCKVPRAASASPEETVSDILLVAAHCVKILSSASQAVDLVMASKGATKQTWDELIPKLAGCFLEARRWRDAALVIADEVESDGDLFRNWLGIEAQMRDLPRYEYGLLIDELRGCAQNVRENNRHSAGLLYYSIGNLIASRTHQYAEALDCLEQARALSPQYDGQAYFCAEFAAAHFEVGQLEEAARWYREAIRLDPSHKHSVACLADTLAFLGRYAEASSVWDGYIALGEPAAHWGLKAKAISALRDATGVEEQTRSGADAKNVLATSGDLAAAMLYDALEPACWRRFLDDALSGEDVHAAMKGWLVMDAFSLDEDANHEGAPAWLPLSMFAYHQEQDELCRLVLECAWKRWGDAGVDSQLGQLPDVDDLDVHGYLGYCEQVFSRLRATATTFTIRSVSEARGVEESIILHGQEPP